MPIISQYQKHPIISLSIFALILATLYIFMSRNGLIEILENTVAIKHWILDLGSAGPILVVVLMSVAIVVSPLPSAPIALASGAAYGHFEGAIYVLLGSEIGAISAFYITRLTGIDIINRWMDGRLGKTMVGSQNSLMLIVFISRLLPFFSFDVISYAAGLTHLSFWRFAIATLAGIIPASFLLAHFGSEMASADTFRVVIALVILGLLTLIPFLFKLYQNKSMGDTPSK